MAGVRSTHDAAELSNLACVAMTGLGRAALTPEDDLLSPRHRQ